MKFTGSIEINQPLQIVAELFADPDSLSEYQDGFVGRELVSGTQGEDGAVSKLYYVNRGREMELTETIVATPQFSGVASSSLSSSGSFRIPVPGTM